MVLNGLKKHFKLIDFKYFIKGFNEDSNIGYFIQDDAQYLQKLHELHEYLPISVGQYENLKKL